jgi:hypothetical protein
MCVWLMPKTIEAKYHAWAFLHNPHPLQSRVCPKSKKKKEKEKEKEKRKGFVIR